jgi:carboxymethylenebutenolidase
MQAYLVNEMVDEYQAGLLTRRELLRRVTLITGSAAVATTVAGTLGPQVAAARPEVAPTRQGLTLVDPFDPAIRAGLVLVPAPNGPIVGYLARPDDGLTHPGVVQIHENRGLQPHNMDVARRLAKAGYVALVVDFLSRQGGAVAFADDAEAIGAQAQVPADQRLSDVNAAVAYLQGLASVQGDRIGAIGFCGGGGMCWSLALINPAVVAITPFYGPIPPLDNVDRLQAAVLGLYAGEDPNVNARIPEAERAMGAAGKTYEVVIYPGAFHAFYNDSGARYNAEAAAGAWGRAMGWFSRYLG